MRVCVSREAGSNCFWSSHLPFCSCCCVTQPMFKRVKQGGTLWRLAVYIRSPGCEWVGFVNEEYFCSAGSGGTHYHVVQAGLRANGRMRSALYLALPKRFPR